MRKCWLSAFSPFPTIFSQGFFIRCIKSCHFEVKDDVYIVAVHSDHVQLKSGKKIPCGIVVWSTGLAPRDFVRALDIPKNNRGQVTTNYMYLFCQESFHFMPPESIDHGRLVFALSVFFSVYKIL